MKKLFCFLLLSVLAMSAAELTGKWSGSFDITAANGDTKADTAYMDLKEKAGEVVGTAGPNSEKQWPIRKGKLSGQKITFELVNEDGQLLVFDLTFDGEAVRGTCAGTNSDGEKMSAKLELKRTS
jgi:hypothetical protein